MQESISHENVSPLAWVICLVGGLFFFYEFIQMNVLNALSHPLMQAFHLRAEGLSLLSSIFFYIDAILLIPAGILLDRVSTRKVMLVNLSFCIFGVVLFALAKSFSLLLVARALTGVGNAFCFLACMRLAALWFPPSRLALISGLIITLGMSGGAVAQTPMVWLAGLMGWREAMMVNAGLGVVILLAIFAFVKDKAVATNETQASEPLSIGKSLLVAAKSRQVWFGGVYTCLLNLPVVLLGALWGSLFLQRVYHLQAAGAATVCSMIFIGMIIGCPAIGYLSDSIRRRKLPMIIGAVLSVLVALPIIEAHQLSFTVLMILFFLLGLITSAQVVTYPLVSESAKPQVISTAMGIASTLIMGGGAVIQDFSGWLLDSHWQHTMKNGVAYYTAADYRYALMVIPVAFALALVCAFGVRETYCKGVN